MVVGVIIHRKVASLFCKRKHVECADLVQENLIKFVDRRKLLGFEGAGEAKGTC